jgi:hypothetical protein
MHLLYLYWLCLILWVVTVILEFTNCLLLQLKVNGTAVVLLKMLLGDAKQAKATLWLNVALYVGSYAGLSVPYWLPLLVE